MKAKVLNRVNAFIAFLLAALGFSGCNFELEYGVPEPRVEYGCPYASFEASGTVTDEENTPVQNIRVHVRSKWGEAFPEVYTDENGRYVVGRYDFFPADSVDIVVTDTADVYASDSVRLKVEYDRSGVAEGNHWDEGEGSVHYDFQLQKK